MQDKQPSNVRPVLLNSLLWLCGVSLLLMSTDAVERFTGPLGASPTDLSLVLAAYVLLFLLEPIRHWINRRLRKHARRRQRTRT
jgi:uncharacterized membrane protein